METFTPDTLRCVSLRCRAVPHNIALFVWRYLHVNFTMHAVRMLTHAAQCSELWHTAAFCGMFRPAPRGTVKLRLKFHGTVLRVAPSWHPREDPRRHARFPRDLLATSLRGCHENAARKTASVEFNLNAAQCIRWEGALSWLSVGFSAVPRQLLIR